MRVWVYYDSAIREAVVYENEPPAGFGRRGYDIGPIEVDGVLREGVHGGEGSLAGHPPSLRCRGARCSRPGHDRLGLIGRESVLSRSSKVDGFGRAHRGPLRDEEAPGGDPEASFAQWLSSSRAQVERQPVHGERLGAVRVADLGAVLELCRDV